MVDLIDRYTQIDDLLRNNQILMGQLLTQQTNTNKLLYTMLKSGQITGVPISGMPYEAITKTDISNIISGGNQYKTFVREFPNHTISTGTTYTLINEKFSGIISEIYLLSTLAQGSTYSIKVTADTEKIYDDTWTNFSARNSYESDMSAFSDATYYVLSLQDIAFNESIVVEIYNANLTFYRIYMKVHRRVME